MEGQINCCYVATLQGIYENNHRTHMDRTLWFQAFFGTLGNYFLQQRWYYCILMKKHLPWIFAQTQRAIPFLPCDPSIWLLPADLRPAALFSSPGLYPRHIFHFPFPAGLTHCSVLFRTQTNVLPKGLPCPSLPGWCWHWFPVQFFSSRFRFLMSFLNAYWTGVSVNMKILSMLFACDSHTCSGPRAT